MSSVEQLRAVRRFARCQSELPRRAALFAPYEAASGFVRPARIG